MGYHLYFFNFWETFSWGKFIRRKTYWLPHLPSFPELVYLQDNVLEIVYLFKIMFQASMKVHTRGCLEVLGYQVSHLLVRFPNQKKKDPKPRNPHQKKKKKKKKK